MHRSRVGVALMMVIALGVMPLTADWCAASCDLAHMTGGTVTPNVTGNVTSNVTSSVTSDPVGSVTSDPVCHRKSQATARLDQNPHPCGHVPSVLPNLIADRAASTSLTQPFAPAVLSTAPSIGIYDARLAHAERGLGPPPESIPLALAFSLRV